MTTSSNPSKIKVIKRAGKIIITPQKRNIIKTQAITHDHFSKHGHYEFPIPEIISAVSLGCKIMNSAYASAKNSLIKEQRYLNSREN